MKGALAIATAAIALALVGGTYATFTTAVEGSRVQGTTPSTVVAPSPEPVTERATSDADSSTAEVLGGVFGGVVVLGVGSALLVPRLQRSSRTRADQRAQAQASAKRLKALRAQADSVMASYAAYASDALEVLKRPLLSDVTEPTTAEFLAALDSVVTFSDGDLRGDELERYSRAVERLSSSWRRADDKAVRVGTGFLSSEDAKKVRRARDLLTLALDPAATEAERVSAFERAKKLVDGLVRLPAPALSAVETVVRPAITGGPARAVELA
jgi:hypothetical protein